MIDSESPNEPQGDSEPTLLVDEELEAASGGKASGDGIIISPAERDGLIIAPE